MVIIRYAIALMLLLAPALQTSALAAEITARPDRNPVSLGESFKLVFEADGSVDDDPDFSPLEQDFDILGSNQSSNISIINGQLSRKKSWILTLMAKREGLFTIPAISFGSDASAPLHLTVKEAPASASPAGGDLFVEVEAEPKQVVVQGQLLCTVRLFHRLEIGSASLSEPELEGSEALIEKLGDDASYETSRDGRRYRVVERRYAIFPQQAGQARIAPIRFEGQVSVPGRSRFGMFDQMMQVKRVQSAGIDLNVLPAAPSASAEHWLPAKAVKLVEEWPQEPPAFTVGEPLTRTLTLVAEGLTAAQLPVIEPALPGGVKGYPDQPVLENKASSTGIIGIRQEKTALIPTLAGQLILPPVEIAWWNVEAGRMETAKIAERAIEVLPAADVKTATSAPQAPPAPLPKSVDPAPAPEAGAVETRAGIWPWLCLGLAIGWAATLLAWLRSRRPQTKRSAAGDPLQNRPNEKNALKRIREGCASHDPLAVKEALLEWARICWSENPPASLGEISRRCEAPLAEEIGSLNQALYGQNRGHWQGAGLWSAFERRQKPAEVKTAEEGTLEPLYKN